MRACGIKRLRPILYGPPCMYKNLLSLVSKVYRKRKLTSLEKGGENVLQNSGISDYVSNFIQHSSVSKFFA